MKKPTNFDRYLDRQLRDPAFARRYRQTEEEWNVATRTSSRSGTRAGRVRPYRAAPDRQSEVPALLVGVDLSARRNGEANQPRSLAAYTGLSATNWSRPH